MSASAARPLVLVVAMADSIHTVRWLSALRASDFRLVLMPATQATPLAAFGDLVPLTGDADARSLVPGQLGLWTWEAKGPADALPAPIGWADRATVVRAADVAAAVDALQPALVHSLEVQLAGYACLGASRLMDARFPRWLVSTWGSDFQLFRKLAAHRPVLEAVARRMDAYLSECRRDVAFTRDLGYTGPHLDAIPATGGANFAALPALADLAPPSARRDIVIKGYHGWSGRALHVLSAVYIAARHLKPFRLRVILASEAVAAMAAALQVNTGLNIVLEPFEASHGEALARLATARLVAGIGISDGIGTTTLEAMALGCFPVVGAASCAGEWLRAGRDGFLVGPHDIAGLARALEIAATDDNLVDDAAIRNRHHVEQHWDAQRNGARAARVYETVLAQPPHR